MESSRRLAANSDAADGDIIMTRILPSFQTVQERNFCSLATAQTSHDPALVRTYYSSDIPRQEQDAAHENMIRSAVLEGLVEQDGVWNDETLYNYGDDWQRVLLRVPELCDRERHALRRVVL